MAQVAKIPKSQQKSEKREVWERTLKSTVIFHHTDARQSGIYFTWSIEYKSNDYTIKLSADLGQSDTNISITEISRNILREILNKATSRAHHSYIYLMK